DGRPLATAVSSGETGDLLATRADCDADGVYALAGLPAGEVELIARSSHAALARTFALAAGERRRWDPLLAGAAAAAARELCGLVVGPGRRPLADWTVIVRQLEPAASTVLQSGSDGRFAIACEADRRFDVLVYEPSQPPSGFAAATRADCSPDDGLLLLAVDPDLPAATLAGRLRTPTGEVAAATVYCWHRDRGQTVEVAADDGGAFEFRGVPPGDVIVACRCAGFLAPHLELVLGAGERRDLGVIALRAGAIVSGRVTATDGKPLRDLAVAIETADGSRLAATCSDAGFRFEAVPAGRHRLLVHGDGIAASAVPIAVEAGVELVQDIRVEPGVSRAISVHDPLGSGGRVTLELGRAGEPRALVLAGGGADPRPVEFTACMPPGTYDAVAWNEAGRRGKARVTFTAGGAPPVAIELRER
ncbi:MAG: carboxypeptidase regulatory-like domain-containing protein, partial [Planctomycetes bacterium]|nr:carboxypeptidase regulatory-like domain-containing protein [Planctomycetota bacterium]